MAKAINKKKAKAVKVAATKKQIVETLAETTKAPLKAPSAVLFKPGLQLDCETCGIAYFCEYVGHSPVTLVDPTGGGGFRRKPSESACRCEVLKVSRTVTRGTLSPANRQITIKQIVSVLSVKHTFHMGDAPSTMQWGVNHVNATFVVSKELCDADNPW